MKIHEIEISKNKDGEILLIQTRFGSHEPDTIILTPAQIPLLVDILAEVIKNGTV